jgi:hypothetical protein
VLTKTGEPAKTWSNREAKKGGNRVGVGRSVLENLRFFKEVDFIEDFCPLLVFGVQREPYGRAETETRGHFLWEPEACS